MMRTSQVYKSSRAKAHAEALEKLMTMIENEVEKTKYDRAIRNSAIRHERNSGNPDPHNAAS